jgi:signal transduction histidine kinase
VEVFDLLLTETALGPDIVAFKLWAPDGTVLYSPNQALIGQSFDPHPELEQAFEGDIVAELSDLSKPENVYERQLWDSLIETYAPVRREGTEEIVAVAEFYQRPDALLADIDRAQTRSWLFVGAATLVMYLLLVGIVHRVSNVIESQRSELEGNVARLRDLLTQNRRLQERMQAAAGRTTAMNERYLHRISADLHDGPAQNVSLALLRLEDLDQQAGNQANDAEDLNTVRSSLDSALTDLRSIARGLRLPEIQDLSPAATARRVLKDFERATGREVEFQHQEVPTDAPLPLKITIYRVLQEALANSFRHANGASQKVTMTSNGNDLNLEIVDDGAGIDPESVHGDEALGLIGMRERVELLGGRFEVTNRTPTGTRIRVCLPLTLDRGAHG